MKNITSLMLNTLVSLLAHPLLKHKVQGSEYTLQSFSRRSRRKANFPKVNSIKRSHGYKSQHRFCQVNFSRHPSSPKSSITQSFFSRLNNLKSILKACRLKMYQGVRRAFRGIQMLTCNACQFLIVIEYVNHFLGGRRLIFTKSTQILTA